TTAQNVSISCTTSGATIRYTTDGSDPTINSAQYTSAISVPLNTRMDIKAIAFKDGLTPSFIAWTIFNVTGTMATPTFYLTDQGITISCATPGATICYTTDGSDPTQNSTLYVAAIPVPSKPMTIKAKAFNANWAESATAVYNVEKVAFPAFYPFAGTYTTAQSVTISCATSGATIRYTTDGTDPTSSSTQYTGAISVHTSLTIKAKAFMPYWVDSETASATYNVSP
ncbi:MAG: chitobiase/beta-hexosaminidase C-terminal domain-containing protein, partial [Deltaproteobacteria bacterium]|nr:chitobiase/beta-hexosaminidase C-terminal domain-containing protein [Deltaproteobacteria bacterium]